MRRGLPTVLLTMPKLALFSIQQVPFGAPNWARLKRLKNSARNCMLYRSPRFVVLNTAKSQLFTPSWVRVAFTRGSSPYDQGAGAAKHAGLNQRCTWLLLMEAP